MDRETQKYPEYREYTGTANSVEYTSSDEYNPYNDHPAWPPVEESQEPRSSSPVQALSSLPDADEQATENQPYRYDPAALYGYREGPLSAGQPEGPKPPRAGAARKAAGAGGLLAAIGGLLLKFQGLAIVLKFGMPALSALLTVVLYSTLFGWPFAVGFVASIFIHEMGHAVVMKSKGISVNGMVFVPFLGAAVFGRRAANAKDEAEIGIAGPVAGALAASVCLALAYIQPNALWAPLAYLGFFINLFNLVPILPLDGGHVLGAVDRRIWIVGFIGLLAFQIWLWFQGNYSWWLLLLVVMAAFQIRNLSLTPQTEAERQFYNVSLTTRIAFTLLYFGLAAVLFMGMNMAHAMIPAMGQ